MLHAAVLAGGLSSRMGQDKRGLVLHGQTLLQRALHLLQSVGAGNILLSGGGVEFAAADGLEAAGNYQVVPDLFPHSGPPGGLYSLLAFLHARGQLDGAPLLLIPVDMPLLTADTLCALIAAAAPADGCHYDGEVFPCVFKATAALHDFVRELFNDGSAPGGKRSMKSILKFVTAAALPIPAGRTAEFRNVNTPEDWQALASDDDPKMQ